MELFKSIFLGNSFSDWLIALGIMVVVFIVLIIVQRLAFRHVRSFAIKTETKLDDLLADLLSDLKKLPMLLLAIYLGSTVLTLQPKISRFIEVALIVTFLIQGGWWGNRIISFFIKSMLLKQGESDEKKSLPTILMFVSRLTLWSLIVLLALDNVGINITTLLAGLGIGGIAIALALQNILEDLFASLSILLDKPFEVGDFLIVGEYLGTVEHIGLKTTRIRSLSGEQNIFSNTDILKSRIKNYKRMSERRVVFTLGVTYQTSFEKLKSIPTLIHDIITGQEITRFDRAHFKEYGESALIFEVVYYVLSADYNIYMDIQEKINLAIFKNFEQAQIEFAYPTRTLIMTTTQDV